MSEPSSQEVALPSSEAIRMYREADSAMREILQEHFPKMAHRQIITASGVNLDGSRGYGVSLVELIGSDKEYDGSYIMMKSYLLNPGVVTSELVEGQYVSESADELRVEAGNGSLRIPTEGFPIFMDIQMTCTNDSKLT